MMGCSSIISMDMSDFINIKEIGCGFLSGCRRLKSVQLWEVPPPTTSPKLTVMGHGAFSDCVALEHIDTTVLSGLTTIPDAFAMNCTSLAHIDLTPLRSVTAIGRQFLYGCSGLKTLDLSPLEAVSTIPAFFLGKCSSLQHLDLSKMLSVKSVDKEGFLLRADPQGIVLPAPPSSQSLVDALANRQPPPHKNK
eukprot:TRINITY_DN10432_c0_g2_i1.p1 TRINITY_DN10432_c0_g2~~TRINITY_DN10432_c0_g2_i1.p1  ORF type:complete len:193 (-),score=25.90 TRINITY_DN10432_c0_g2_i1:289-867(-)